MKKWIIMGVAVFFVLLLILAFVSPGEARLPAYPETVSVPREYWLDEDRSIEVARDEQGLTYMEAKISSRKKQWGGLSEFRIAESRELDVLIQEGWAIGFEAPDTIVIELGNGEIIRRKHGQMDLKMNTDGGPIDFQDEFERIKEKASKDRELQLAPENPEQK